ncbi:DUF718 domain-containing protein [Fusarium pseudoanthophilum]|uniref:DUF718 domain-containing protein n=1 Tax=Fusarium pseudoanthophilum TaxID=48495 RepID=A0A8H5PM55_9HYPO|nr:DUF718 domain-containing protein [Fusarium pseudoanthophilum]
MSDEPTRRFAQIIKLKPKHVAEYKQVHARVWPEVLAQNEQCNIRDFQICYRPADSIFYDDQSHYLFASFKYVGTDFATDMKAMAQNPRVREWWKMTDAFQESLVPGAVSSESVEPSWWKPIEEVFYQP